MANSPVLSATGLRQFDAHCQQAAAEMTRRFLLTVGKADAAAADPALAEAYRQDVADHLAFMRPALEFGDVQPMVDYVRWLEHMLTRRGVPKERLRTTLDGLADYFETCMQGADAGVVAAAIRVAKAGLLAPAEPASQVPAGPNEPWPDSLDFSSALLAGDRPRAQALVNRHLAQGRTLPQVELHLMQPALYDVGQRWEDNQVTVAQEHLATAICESVMTQAFMQVDLPASNGRKVLLACVAGNKHAVGLQMVADAFQLAGWEVQFLGADVPTADLVEHVVETRPEVLGLSISFVQQFRVVQQIMAGLKARLAGARPRVLLGGSAINQFERLAAVLGADACTTDAAAAVQVASLLTGTLARTQ